MGGTVGITIRTKKFEIYNFEKCSNCIPAFIDNLKFIQKDESHLMEFISDEKKMAIPNDYGFIFIDLVQNIILDMNYYCTFGKISFAEVQLDVSCLKNPNFYGAKDDLAYVRLQELINSGKVTKYEKYNSAEESFDEFSITKSIDNVMDDNSIGNFLIDMYPFKIIKFDDKEKLQKAIEKLGFEFSKEELTHW